MLKKKIVVFAMAVCFSVPSLSQASPLSWISGTDALVKLARLWERLPGVHPARPAVLSLSKPTRLIPTTAGAAPDLFRPTLLPAPSP